MNYAPRDGWMFGSADVLDVTTGGLFVAPLKSDYSYGAQTRATLLTADDRSTRSASRASRCGDRRARPVRVRRAKFSPADKLI